MKIRNFTFNRIYWRGITFAILASLLFAVTYTFYKLSLPAISGVSLLCIQSVIALLCLLPFILKEGISSVIMTDQLGKLLLRSVCGLGSVYFMLLALKTTSLAEVTLLNNIAPLCVPLLASIWMKEKINHRLWPSLCLGFIGITLILAPWKTGDVSTGLIYALISGFFAGSLIIATKQISHQPFLRVLFYNFFFFSLMTSPFAWGSWTTIPSLIWIYIFAAAVMLLLSQWSFTAALRHAPSQVVAPFFYLLVIFSMFSDWILWKNSPSWLTFLGMGLVMIAGIITLLLSHRRVCQKAVVIVEPVGSGSFYKKAAHDMGYHVIGVFQYPDSFYDKQVHLEKKVKLQGCDTVIHSTDLNTVLEHLKTTGLTVQGCIAGHEVGMELAEKIAVALGLPSNPIGTAETLRDKAVMRKRLQKSGLSCPDFTVCESVHDVKEFARQHPFPLVIKAPKGAGTSQVFVCNDEDELIKHFRLIMQQDNPYGGHAPYAVVEEFIGGKEYIVNTFSDADKTHITDVWSYDKLSTDSFENIYYNVISVPLDDPSIQSLCSYAIQVVNAYLIQRGHAHIEIKQDPIRGPILIEIAGRLAGANLPEMVAENSNFNPFRAGIEACTKALVLCPSPIIFYKHLALCFCPVLHTGMVKKIRGIEEIVKLNSYVRHALSLHVGDKIESSTDLASIHLNVQLASKSRDQLFKDVEKVHSLFSVDIEPF